MNRRKALSPERSLHRRKPTREPRARFLILCEGKVTEPEYFRYVKQSLRDYLLVIEVAPNHGNPLQLVEAATEKRRSAQRNARMNHDDNLNYDHIWCVMDVDNHPQLSAAKSLADKHGISLAISNPCFELWPLLHFTDQRAYVSIEKVQAALRRHMPGYEKKLDCARLRGGYQLARQRATEIHKQHERNGKGSDQNPSTTVPSLIEALLEGGKQAGALTSSHPL
jgi:hypothetical protein